MNIKLLDSGYVTLVEHMGSDERIIEAARMSVDKGFISWEPYDGAPKGDAGLLRHLYMNKHATPFEMADIIFEIKAPIMVFREWHRHRTQSYNEMSARYVPIPNDHYVPTLERCMTGAASGTSNKQAQSLSGTILTEDQAQDWLLRLEQAYDNCQQVYEEGLNIGIPKELARLPMPVARYSRMRAKANLRNWLGFLLLRYSPFAQYEIRVYAEAIHKILSELYPRTLALYDEEAANSSIMSNLQGALKSSDKSIEEVMEFIRGS